MPARILSITMPASAAPGSAITAEVVVANDLSGATPDSVFMTTTVLATDATQRSATVFIGVGLTVTFTFTFTMPTVSTDIIFNLWVLLSFGDAIIDVQSRTVVVAAAVSTLISMLLNKGSGTYTQGELIQVTLRLQRVDTLVALIGQSISISVDGVLLTSVISADPTIINLNAPTQIGSHFIIASFAGA